jgi:hypothetical protein
MAKRLLSYDPITGVRTYHDYDHDTKKTYITEEQDVEAILNHNKKLANDSSYKKQGIKDDWYHFATVPNTVLLEIMKKHNISIFNNDDLPKFERILQSNEYRYLRTVDRI